MSNSSNLKMVIKTVDFLGKHVVYIAVITFHLRHRGK
jgi:hypothetical protein